MLRITSSSGIAGYAKASKGLLRDAQSGRMTLDGAPSCLHKNKASFASPLLIITRTISLQFPFDRRVSSSNSLKNSDDRESDVNVEADGTELE